MAQTRLAWERAAALEGEARKQCDNVIAAAAATRKAAKEALHRQHAASFDRLRSEREVALQQRPRTEAVAAEIERIEAEMRDFKKLPPPDFSAIDAEFAKTAREADLALADEIRSIRRRLKNGELD